MPALDLAPVSRVMALVVLTGIATVQGVMICADVVLQPATPSLRWVRVTDETARYLQIWTRRLVLVGVIGFFGSEAALTLGMPDGAYTLVTRLVGLVMALLVIVVIMQSRHTVAAWIRSRRLTMTVPPMAEAAPSPKARGATNIRQKLARAARPKAQWSVIAKASVVSGPLGASCGIVWRMFGMCWPCFT